MGLMGLAGPFDYLMPQGGGALLEARRIKKSKKQFFCFINATSTSPMAIKGPDVGSSDPGPRGPKSKKPIFMLFWAPGHLPNRCALKFHATYTYFHNFWWHGMKILIF